MPNGPDVPTGVDLAALGSIETDLGLDSLRELITLFLDDAAKQLPGAHAAAAEGRADKVKLIAHRLKSISYYLGARAVHSQCEGIETVCKEGGAPDLVAEVKKLEALLGSARPALEAYAARKE